MQIHRLAKRAQNICVDLDRFPQQGEYDELRETARRLLHEVSRRAEKVPDIEIPPPHLTADSFVVHARSADR